MMESNPILPLFKDLAYFLLSTLHLLLTRILPLIALLLGSLVLHLIRFASSFLFNTKTPQRSGKRLTQRRRALQGRRSADESFQIHDDALQEALIDQGGSASALLQELESYEDCTTEDEDNENDLNDAQLQWLQEQATRDWRFVREVKAEEGGDGERQVGDGVQGRDGENAKMGDGESVLREERDRYRDVGGAVLQAEMAGAEQEAMKVGDHGLDDIGSTDDDEEVGDGYYDAQEQGSADDEKMDDGRHDPQELQGRDEEEVGDLQAKPILESQGSLGYPSDLPRSLDNVVIAAAVNNAAEEKGVSREMNRGQRPLVPTFSSVAEALRLEMRSANNLHGAGDTTSSGPTRTSSYERFMTKFKQHFQLEAR